MNFTVGSYYRGFHLYNALVATGTMDGDVLLYVSFYSRSKVLCKGVASAIALNNATLNHRKVASKGFKYAKAYKPIKMGLDRFTLATCVNKEIGTRFLVSAPKFMGNDLYQFLMLNYQVELLPEWVEKIREKLFEKNLIRLCSGGYRSIAQYRHFVPSEACTTISMHGEEIPIRDVVVLDFARLTEELFEEVIEELGNEGEIQISSTLSEKMEIADLNSYITVFGRKGALKIAENTTPLVPEDEAETIEDMALNDTHMIPQQNRMINGVAALMAHHKRFALMVEGMGCGKTKQAISSILLNENRKAMMKGGFKDLKELYTKSSGPKFRAIVMCPPHLCEMWKREWEKEVPRGKAKILSTEGGLQELVDLQTRGAERTGAELYIISKEFAKTDAVRTPIPSQTGVQVPKGVICADCKETTGDTVYKPNGKNPSCPHCGGKNWQTIPLTGYGRKYAMLCPECGSPLIKYSTKYWDLDDPNQLTLKPTDFSQHRDSNDTCYVCGAHLWGVDAKNIGASENTSGGRKWKKITHYKNLQKKSRDTAYILKGHEREYLNEKGLPTEQSKWEEEGIRETLDISGPRKSSPAQYIKKHLKGFFDYCVLDECHKYEGAGTAQAVAAQALIKASGFTLALTGTISNGKADSLFYLLWMLCPRKMVKKCYKFTDVMQFSRDYGSVETAFEVTDGFDDQRNANSRGRQIGSPRIKPGISPMLQLDFLTGHAVFLDLSDMASALPPLNEEVVTAQLPDEVQRGYEGLMARMRDVVKSKGGRSYLATWLQTSLAYPSKPWGISPIMSVKDKDTIMCTPENFPEYESLDNLLPKEELFIEKVQEELDENRNIFVYCSFTGDPQKNCTGRLKALVEKYCNLQGKVLVMEAGRPEAQKREEYIHQKAAEGYKVIICNQKLVETGLDFCFNYDGQYYNFPTIIVFQITYELAVQMQSTRRHYRLNQREECRTYYFVTENTAEMAALSLMADKQVAAAALQGNFNTEGLSAMASGVDDKVKLVQMMTAGDNGDAKSEIEAKFSKLQRSQSHAESVEDLFNAEGRTKTFSEVMGTDAIDVVYEEAEEAKKTATKATPTTTATKKATKTTTKKKSTSTAPMQMFSLFDVVSAMEPVIFNAELEDRPQTKKAKKIEKVSGQLSLSDLFSAA